jgi:transposase
MVGEHRGDYGSEWAAMASIAVKIGCTAALAANDRDRPKLLEREVKELRRANECESACNIDPGSGVIGVQN